MYEVIRHERSVNLLLLLTNPFILKQSKFTDHEINIIKNLSLGKLQCQKRLKEYFALQL